MEAELREDTSRHRAHSSRASDWLISRRPRRSATCSRTTSRELTTPPRDSTACSPVTRRTTSPAGGTRRARGRAEDVRDGRAGADHQGPRARERLEVEVAEAERAMERARDDEAAARARVEQNAVDAEEVAALAEEAAGQQERLSELRRRARVLPATRDRHRDRREGDDGDRDALPGAAMVGDLGGRWRSLSTRPRDDATVGSTLAPDVATAGSRSAELAQGNGSTSVPRGASSAWPAARHRDRRHRPLVLDDPFVTLDDRVPCARWSCSGCPSRRDSSRSSS